ncbi:restriction endonuclease [Agrococcus sediminis]|uniref:restriction endonuclease n=1 Tax=Agrococcus sediminis TaxID=2599924 RepID=UPI00343D5C9E
MSEEMLRRIASARARPPWARSAEEVLAVEMHARELRQQQAARSAQRDRARREADIRARQRSVTSSGVVIPSPQTRPAKSTKQDPSPRREIDAIEWRRRHNSLARGEPVRTALSAEILSPRRAEFAVRDWLRRNGFPDAEVTPEKGDGGIDVTSSTMIAQVKHYNIDTGVVGVAPVRELFGVLSAGSVRKQALFFTSGRYSSGALDFARRNEIVLYRYRQTGSSIEATPVA